MKLCSFLFYGLVWFITGFSFFLVVFWFSFSYFCPIFLFKVFYVGDRMAPEGRCHNIAYFGVD